MKNENLRTLTMDNGACNNDQKLSVTSSIEHFEYLAKQYFNWRTSTKQYKSIFERLTHLGSSEYDKFILYCYNLGYQKCNRYFKTIKNKTNYKKVDIKMLNKIFKDYTTYQKVVKWFNANKYISEIQGLELIDYPINKVINIQVTGGKIWAIAIVDDKVSYFIMEDEVIEDGKLDKLINFKLIKNMNKTEVLKNIDMNMKGLEEMKKLYNKTVKNNNIEEVEEVTNEQKALQMIKNETIEDTIKYEVIEWVESKIEYYDNIEDIFNDLFTGGCESGIVTNLIYYDDTIKYFDDHESEIIEMLEQLGIENVESWDGLQELSEMFPQLDSADDRHQEAEEKAREKAEEETPDYYDSEWDEMDEDEKTEAIQEYSSNIMMYESDPMELNTQDKNYLAWASFEHEASLLYDEYIDVLNELYTEAL